MSMMTVKDLAKLPTPLNQAGLDYQLELENGKILVVEPPSDIDSSEIGGILIRLLGNWVYLRRLGRLLDCAGNFILLNTELKAPDVSFVRASRLRQGRRYFTKMVPALAVGIKSQSYSIKFL